MAEQWQENFKEYTSGAFTLSLSARHCEMLMAFEEDGKGIDPKKIRWNGRDMFVPCIGGLKRRGLVEHNNTWSNPESLGKGIYETYRLTTAGALVRGLLILAGREFKEGEPNAKMPKV